MVEQGSHKPCVVGSSPSAASLEEILLAAESFGLLEKGDKVLVGVSGGRDSVALLLSLFGSFELVAAHFNHATRGRESDRDEAFVRKLCEKLGVKLVTEKAKAPPKNEGEARKLRYEFLKNSALRVGANKIATGHTLDDQIETFLMRILRGTGIEGVVGIKPLNDEICAPIPVVRPLLLTTRKETEEFLKLKGMTWVNDSTNLDERILRNRIRLKIIPAIEREFPNFKERFRDFWLSVHDTVSLQKELMREVIEKKKGTKFFINLDNLPPILRKFPQIFSAFVLSEFFGSGYGVDRYMVDKVKKVMFGRKPNARTRLKKRVIIKRSYNKVEIGPEETDVERESEVEIEGLGEHRFKLGSREYSLKISAVKPSKFESKGFKVHLSPSILSGKMKVRTWKPGDRFRPFGLKGTKKLKDYFQSEKVPLDERRRIPILEFDGKIVWIFGMRISGDFAVEGEEAIEIEAREINCRSSR